MRAPPRGPKVRAVRTSSSSDVGPVPPGGRTEWLAVRLRAARLHREASRVDSVRLRYHSPRRGCRVEAFEPSGEATLSLDDAADGVAPGQVACLMDGDLVVGHGTVA